MAMATNRMVRRCFVGTQESRRQFCSGGGYKSIGSFHSENVENLLQQTDYTPPALPFEALSQKTNEEAFMLNRKEWTFLNHGAFGASLQCGYDRAQQWRAHLEEQPLRYFDRDLLPHLTYSARRLAEFINADRQGMALLPNVTAGLNAAISGYVREYAASSSKILLWDVSYGSVKKMAQSYCDNVMEIPLLPLNKSPLLEEDDDILQAFEDYLQTQPSPDFWTNTLFIMDHTTSNTALNLPIEKLAKRAKELGMIVMVDGAHGLLAQPLDFSALSSVDMYLSNGHKWLSCPRGVAFIYCPSPHLRETILKYPAVISHGVHDGYFSRFLWDGCRDYAAQLSLPPVLDFWQHADPTLVRSWLRTKLKDAVQLITERWHPQYASAHDDSWAGNVTLGDMSLHSPMVLVKLPPLLCGDGDKTSLDAKRIQDYLYSRKIEVPIKCINGILYVRLSCHVYNELREYDILAQGILEFP